METGIVRSYGEESLEQVTRVTRSIMIVKPPGYQSGSPPISPAGSTPPVSPFSGMVVIDLFVLLCTDSVYRTVKLNCLITIPSELKGAPKFGVGEICLLVEWPNFQIFNFQLI